MKNICCVCLETTEEPQNLNNSDNNDVKLLNKLQVCVPEINWKIYFTICTECQIKVNVSYDLRETCLRGETNNLRHAKCESQAENSVSEATSKVENNVTSKSGIVENKEELNFPSDENFIRDNDSSSEDGSKTIIKKGRKIRTKFPVKCEYCFKEFNRTEHLYSHIRSIHTHEKPYSCNTCEKRFSISQSLLVHKRRHNNEKPYCCTYCGKQFSCSADLYHHNQIHLNKRDYKCDNCGKCFNTASILRKHKICAHTDPSDWKYECNYCKRRFPMGGNLKTHLRRHDNEKNFVCEICQKAFYDKFILQRHVRTHTNERSFKCKLCEKEYKDNCSLNIHLKKVHDVGNATVPQRSRKFVCHICPKTFTSDDKLQKHINSHSGFKPYKCEHCDKSFSDSWYRKKHTQQKHFVL